MIRVIAHRKKDREECPAIETNRTVLNALQLLIEFELGYGGQLIDVSPTKVVTETQVLGCQDKTEFMGSEEEMKPLVHFAGVTIGLFEMAITNDKIVDLLVKKTQGKAMLLANYAPILVGQGAMRGAIGHMLGMTKEDIRATKLKDMIVGYQLLHEGCSPEQVKELLCPLEA
jgi:hypothetical protein